MNPRRKTKEEIPKKKCTNESCERVRSYTFFYKVDSPIFPDGMLNICRDCVRDQVDIEDMDSIIGFLRQIDKPFHQKEWDNALKAKGHPIGVYLSKINSLVQYKGETFNNSDGFNGFGKIDLSSAKTKDEILNLKGEKIFYSDELVDKWGIGYKKEEYLKMEKFYQDMRFTHEINTPVHIGKLMELAYLQIELTRLRKERAISDYTKLASTIDKMEQSSGFRPVDRQGLDDATGMRSFSQIFEEVEKRGFRMPPVVEIERDIVDAMIVSLGNYYNRIVGRQILAEIPDEIKEELDEFYELDETPVEINDEEYEYLDFGLEEDLEPDENQDKDEDA